MYWLEQGGGEVDVVLKGRMGVPARGFKQQDIWTANID